MRQTEQLKTNDPMHNINKELSEYRSGKIGEVFCVSRLGGKVTTVLIWRKDGRFDEELSTSALDLVPDVSYKLWPRP